MSSRKKAEKRLVGEQKQLDKNPVPGVSVGPKDNNLMEWNAFIFGEGEMFELELSFTNFYPLEAPKVKFLTKIDHPKVGEDGTVHLDILSDNWSPTYHIGEILKSIKELLSNSESQSTVYQETAPAPQVNPNMLRLMQTWLNQNQNSSNLNNGESQEMKSESNFEAPDNGPIIMVLKTQLRDLKKLPKKDYECAVKVLSHLFCKLLQDPNNPKFRDLNLSKIRDKSISALEILYTVGFEQDGNGERLQFNVNKIDLINEANKLLTLIKMGKEIPCNCPNCLLKREIERIQCKKCCCPRCRLKLQRLAQATAMAKENRNFQLERYQARMNDNWERKDNNDSNDSDDNDDGPCIIIFRNENGNRNGNRNYQNSFQIESPFSVTVNDFSNNNNDNNNSDNESGTESKSDDWSKQNGQY